MSDGDNNYEKIKQHRDQRVTSVVVQNDEISPFCGDGVITEIRTEWMSSVSTWEKNLLDREKSKCKGPETGALLTW